MTEDNEEWPRRRCLLKAAEIFDDVCARSVGQYVGSGREIDQREMILLASLLRARRMLLAIASLSHDGFVEEMWCIMRSLSELTIDACYLSICSDEEVEKFTQYTHIAHARFLEVFERDMDAKEASISDETRQLMSKIVQSVTDSTGLRSNAISWTSVSVIDRAKAIDKVVRLDPSLSGGASKPFVSFARGVFASGHLYAHSSFEALWPYIKMIKDGTPLQNPDREERVDHVLSGANHCIFVLTTFANHHLKLGLDAFLTVANSLNARG
jgi:hypothetical protein